MKVILFFITGKVSRTLSTHAKVSSIERNTKTSATLHLDSRLPYDRPLTYKNATGLVSQIPKWHSAVDGWILLWFCFQTVTHTHTQPTERLNTCVPPHWPLFFLSPKRAQHVYFTTTNTHTPTHTFGRILKLLLPTCGSQIIWTAQPCPWSSSLLKPCGILIFPNPGL